MSRASIQSAIKTAIESVSGISGGDGSVLDFQPSVFRFDDFVTQFTNTANDTINGWVLFRERTNTVQVGGGMRIQETHHFRIRGFFGLDTQGSTEGAFQDLVDGVVAAVKAKLTIHVQQPGVAAPGAQVESVGHIMLSGNLVHTCEILVSVEEFTEIT